MRTFRWAGKELEVVYGGVVVYDDPDLADELAAALGTYSKHARNKFPVCRCGQTHWRTFSIVPLKDDVS